MESTIKFRYATTDHEINQAIDSFLFQDPLLRVRNPAFHDGLRQYVRQRADAIQRAEQQQPQQQLHCLPLQPPPPPFHQLPFFHPQQQVQYPPPPPPQYNQFPTPQYHPFHQQSAYYSHPNNITVPSIVPHFSPYQQNPNSMFYQSPTLPPPPMGASRPTGAIGPAVYPQGLYVVVGPNQGLPPPPPAPPVAPPAEAHADAPPLIIHEDEASSTAASTTLTSATTATQSATTAQTVSTKAPRGIRYVEEISSFRIDGAADFVDAATIFNNKFLCVTVAGSKIRVTGQTRPGIGHNGPHRIYSCDCPDGISMKISQFTTHRGAIQFRFFAPKRESAKVRDHFNLVTSDDNDESPAFRVIPVYIKTAINRFIDDSDHLLSVPSYSVVCYFRQLKILMSESG
jgi:hypothetical protein